MAEEILNGPEHLLVRFRAGFDASGKPVFFVSGVATYQQKVAFDRATGAIEVLKEYPAKAENFPLDKAVSDQIARALVAAQPILADYANQVQAAQEASERLEQIRAEHIALGDEAKALRSTVATLGRHALKSERDASAAVAKSARVIRNIANLQGAGRTRINDAPQKDASAGEDVMRLMAAAERTLDDTEAVLVKAMKEVDVQLGAEVDD